MWQAVKFVFLPLGTWEPKVQLVAQLVAVGGLSWVVNLQDWADQSRYLALLGLVAVLLLVAVLRLYWRDHPEFVFKDARLEWIADAAKYMLKIEVAYHGPSREFAPRLQVDDETVGIGWVHEQTDKRRLGGKHGPGDVRIGWIDDCPGGGYHLVPTGPGEQFLPRPPQEIPITGAAKVDVVLVSDKAEGKATVSLRQDQGPWVQVTTQR